MEDWYTDFNLYFIFLTLLPFGSNILHRIVAFRPFSPWSLDFTNIAVIPILCLFNIAGSKTTIVLDLNAEGQPLLKKIKLEAPDPDLVSSPATNDM